MDNPTVQAVTLAIAVLGALLGVLNTWRGFSADRVKVRVAARYADAYGHNGRSTPAILVEVVNLSTFPVTVTHFGFDIVREKSHMQIPRPIFTRGEELPVRLEARTACTVIVPLSTMEHDQLVILDRAYVLTACGRKLKSGRRLLRQIADAAVTARVDQALADRANEVQERRHTG